MDIRALDILSHLWLIVRERWVYEGEITHGSAKEPQHISWYDLDCPDRDDSIMIAMRYTHTSTIPIAAQAMTFTNISPNITLTAGKGNFRTPGTRPWNAVNFPWTLTTISDVPNLTIALL